MGWFERDNRPPPPHPDSILLRDALVLILEAVQEVVKDARIARIETVMARLQRFPPPTGLLREIRQIRGDLLLPRSESLPDPEKVEGRDVGRLLGAFGELLGASSLIHLGLENRISELRSAMPRRVTTPDIERLVESTEALAKDAHLLRARAIEDRTELANLLKEMARRLTAADEAGAKLGKEITSIVENLVHEPIPEDLRSVRASLIARVDRLSKDVGGLREQLEAAKDRSRALEDRVQQQADELLDIKARAALDPMTGLCHKGTWEKALPAAIKRASANGSPLSLISLDIDHFKVVNDQWGHPAGDLVIIGVAKALQDQVRDGDVVARVGGEEFCLLLPGAPVSVALGVAERIRLACSELRFGETARHVRITISAGVTVLIPGDTAKSLVKRGDQALYAAKHGGRNMVVVAER